jgi:hypothetical protein
MKFIEFEAKVKGRKWRKKKRRGMIKNGNDKNWHGFW